MNTTRKPASSLVIVLLTIAAASVVILSGAGALINTARQRGSAESRTNATLMADSALQDGYYRFANAAGSLSTLGQYGSLNGVQLSPVTHGYTKGSSCSTLASDAQSVDTGCSTYQLAVRTVLTPQNPQTVGYTYTSRDLPLNQAVKVLLPSFNLSVTFTVTSCVGCTFSFEELNAAGAVIHAGTGVSTFYTVTDGATKALNITATNYNTALNGSSHHNVLKATSPSNSNFFTIGTGFTTIEATGIAADGTKERKLAIIRLFDTPSIGATPAVSKSLKTISQQFTPDGYCTPLADLCR